MAWTPALQCRGHQRVPAAVNIRIIGRSEGGWRMQSLTVGAAPDENFLAARVVPDPEGTAISPIVSIHLPAAGARGSR